MAMMSRSLRYRFNRLERRFGPPKKAIVHVIRFVEGSGEVTSTLTLDHNAGSMEWWYAPGHEPTTSPTPVQIGGIR